MSGARSCGRDGCAKNYREGRGRGREGAVRFVKFKGDYGRGSSISVDPAWPRVQGLSSERPHIPW